MIHYRFYNLLLPIRVAYLYLFTVLFAAFSLLLWWFFLYQPSIVKHLELQQSIEQMHIQIAELRKTEKAFNGISQSIDAQTLQKTSASKVTKTDVQNCLALIADSAMSSGISMESCKMLAQQEVSWCRVTDISGNFKGSFDQIICFLDILKQSKQIIDIVQCKIVVQDAGLYSLHALFKIYCA
jgi:Tfp pilus assembly protein PilO